MRINRTFFVLLLSVVLLVLYVSLRLLNQINNKHTDVTKKMDLPPKVRVVVEDYHTSKMFTSKPHVDSEKLEMKYILQWTSSRNVPFVYMGKEQEGFTSRNCPFTNCVVTSDKKRLGDISKFDVIVLNGPDMRFFNEVTLPQKRSAHQKYAFATIESSHYYPICNPIYNNFFNWTWTFRLDSDVRWGYMVIRDSDYNIVGPNKVMHWIKVDDMDPVSDDVKESLKSKSKAVAWFVSNCYDRAGRLNLAKELKKELENYSLVLDIYGACGDLKCPSETVNDCEKMLKTDYYFYLSFENSFSEDYVTEKLLKALQNQVVPIVFGGGNYTRYMPDGGYLNAKTTPVDQLAKKINELIENPEEYANYFRWKNHYSYHGLHDDVETDEYCRFCSILNDEKKVKTTSILKDFTAWWNNPNYCKPDK